MTENQKNILLVIHSGPQTRRYVEELLLTRREFSLEFCEEPENAIRIAHDLLPDVILLDTELDGVDSSETCRRLRADSHLGGVPILVLLDPAIAKPKPRPSRAGRMISSANLLTPSNCWRACAP